MECCEVKCWFWIWSCYDVVMERCRVERVIRWCVTVINMSEWLTRLCAADVSEWVIDSWWWLTSLYAADVSERVIDSWWWLTRLCAADVSEWVIDSWWWLTRLCAADVSVPDVDKQLDGCCDVVLRLRRSPACSHGLLGHIVAYTVSYCPAEAADAGETLIATNEYSIHLILER